MGIMYLRKNKSSKKRPCYCNRCGKRILWAVERAGKHINNVPIEYDAEVEDFYYDLTSAKVYFDQKMMKKHSVNCKTRGRV